jgi:hypothetical protein
LRGRDRRPYALLNRGREQFILVDAVSWDMTDIELWRLDEDGQWRVVKDTCTI